MTCLLSCLFLNSSLLLPLTLAPSFSLALTLPSSWPPSPFFTLSPFRPLYSSLSPSLPLPLSFKVACCPWAPLSWRSTARGTAEGDTSLLSSPCKVTATPHSLLNECLSVYMSVCLSVCQSVCLSVCLSMLFVVLTREDRLKLTTSLLPSPLSPLHLIITPSPSIPPPQHYQRSGCFWPVPCVRLLISASPIISLPAISQ